jgi:integrase
MNRGGYTERCTWTAIPKPLISQRRWGWWLNAGSTGSRQLVTLWHDGSHAEARLRRSRFRITVKNALLTAFPRKQPRALPGFALQAVQFQKLASCRRHDFPCKASSDMGVSDKVIQAILRHANLNTTMNVYVKSVAEDSVKAIQCSTRGCALRVRYSRRALAAQVRTKYESRS